MKILMTISSISPESGGPAKSVTGLSQGLATRGVSVSLFTIGTADNLIIDPRAGLPYQLSLQLPESSIFRGGRTIGRMADDLKKTLGEGGEAIIHNHGIWLPVNRLASRFARNNRVPLVISTRGMLEPWAMEFKKRKKRFAWELYQKRDLNTAVVIHATAVQEAENLRRLGLRQPIAVIPNGVDEPPSGAVEKPSDRERTILFLGRIHPIKGLVNLVEAWNRVRPEGWRVRIAGPDEGGHQGEIRERVGRYRLDEQFEFLGPVYDEKKWDLYAAADLFVLPSFSENFGIVVAEALASGVPAITTRGTPWKELVAHNCGWWVEPGIEPLAAALHEAVSLSDATRRDMGERGRALIKNGYSWSRIASDMSAVYGWILGGGSPPACVMTD